MENNDVVTDTVKTEEAEVKTERTWTRDEVNKMIATEKSKAVEKALEDYKKQVQEEQTEAQRLANMKESERQAELLKKAEERANAAENRLNAYQLKEQTIKDNTDIPIELINLIDFSIHNTAEKVQTQLDTIRAVYKKSVEDGLNETLREKIPRTVVNDTTTTKPRVSRESI